MWGGKTARLLAATALSAGIAAVSAAASAAPSDSQPAPVARPERVTTPHVQRVVARDQVRDRAGCPRVVWRPVRPKTYIIFSKRTLTRRDAAAQDANRDPEKAIGEGRC